MYSDMEYQNYDAKQDTYLIALLSIVTNFVCNSWFQWVLFGAQIVIRAVVPDEPAFVSIQRGRTAHIASKIIDKVRDDDDDSLVTATKLIKVSDIGEIKESAPGM